MNPICLGEIRYFECKMDLWGMKGLLRPLDGSMLVNMELIRPLRLDPMCFCQTEITDLY